MIPPNVGSPCLPLNQIREKVHNLVTVFDIFAHTYRVISWWPRGRQIPAPPQDVRSPYDDKISYSSGLTFSLYSILIFVDSLNVHIVYNSPLSKMEHFKANLFLCFLFLVGSSTGRIPSLILDTDMDFDVDDVGALCLAHSLQVHIHI